MLPTNKVMLIGFTKPGCDALQLLHSLLQNALLVLSGHALFLSLQYTQVVKGILNGRQFSHS